MIAWIRPFFAWLLRRGRPAWVRCENCVYWWRYDAPDVDEDGVASVGRCQQRAPPVHVGPDDDDAYTWIYPKTESDFGCGRFRRTWPREACV